MALKDIGFRPTDVQRLIKRNGELLIPAMIDGDEACMVIRTGVMSDVVLDMDYVARRWGPVEVVGQQPAPVVGDPPLDYGYASTGSIHVLGRVVSGERVLARRLAFHDSDPPIAGVVGAPFFYGGVLGIDSASGEIGYTLHSVAWEHGTGVVLSLISNGAEVLPITRGIVDVQMDDDQSPVMLLATGSNATWLAMDYIERKAGYRLQKWLCRKGYRSRRPLRWTFAFPDGKFLNSRVWML